MKHLSILLFIIFLVALTVDWANTSNVSYIKAIQLFEPSQSESKGLTQDDLDPVSLPVSLDLAKNQALLVKLERLGYFTTGRLELSFKGVSPVYLNYGSEWVTLSPKNNKCTSQPKTLRYNCILLVSLSGEKPLWVNINAKKDTILVEKINFTEAQSKRSTALKGNILFFAFILLALVGPLYVKLQKYPVLENALIIMTSSSFLIFLNGTGFLFIISFLLLAFALVQLLLRTKDKKFLYLILGGALLIIIIIKVLFPYLADLFANPGNFWLVLPLGFSYFIIRLIDLTLSAYSGHIKNISLLEFMAFMLFPATLPAGPIFTIEGFQNSKINAYDIIDYSAGLARVCVGITKKIVADGWIYPIVSSGINSYIADPESTTASSALIFLAANTLFVFIDFSAYSDIAIGTGRTMGRRVPENFNFPLLRPSLREFWKNWHMTLSNWVMRRVFMTAVMTSRSTSLATLASMMAIGLWHAIGIPWFLWAVHHSSMLILEQKISEKKQLFNIQIRNDFISMLHQNIKWSVGVIIVWFWVSLGHTFTIFSNYEMSLSLYYKIMTSPISYFIN